MPDEEEIYQGKRILVKSDDKGSRLDIDGEQVRISGDPDTGSYGTNLLAYRQYTSPMALAKAMIDNA